MSRYHSIRILTLAAVGWMVMAGVAWADMLAFTAELKGANEVPPTAATATGTVTATYDTTSKSLSWKGSYDGLTGDATAAHFHGPAEAGANAGVAVPMPAFKSPFTGTAGLTDVQAADLIAGKFYFNIHTAANPKGEIRGQLRKDQ